MFISDLINHLNRMQAAHGDLLVTKPVIDGYDSKFTNIYPGDLEIIEGINRPGEMSWRTTTNVCGDGNDGDVIRNLLVIGGLK
jgi:hypothetical protein|tara:strand:- start:206 stop:454 length:249 start_codon:yes stop_codon:yes gene_type:complete